MFDQLARAYDDVDTWEWAAFAPYYADLAARDLSDENVEGWLGDWTLVHDLLEERRWRLYVQTTLHTTDPDIDAAFDDFMKGVYPDWQKAEQTLKDMILESGLRPEGFDLPLQKIRWEGLIFSESNLDLEIEEQRIAREYNKIVGAQTIEWEGQEHTLTQLTPLSQRLDRADREIVWRAASARVLEDREAINKVWQQLLDIRVRMAANVGMRDHREYAWHKRLRFDYTPEDCETFHAAIEEVVVPATRRAYERRAARMGIEALRPWDISLNVMRTTDLVIDVYGSQPETPFADAEDLAAKASAVFHRVDPALGEEFDILRQREHLDLANYKGKAPGAYCVGFPKTRLPFIFQNAVGIAGDVDTILHESGHAFHVFERVDLPYFQQRVSPMEFNEVASMAMEELGSPYLLAEDGGFFSRETFARNRITHLEEMLVFWPYMAVMDGFQHWAYTHPEAAADPAQCDARWLDLWKRFIQGVDWSGLEDEAMTGWHRKLHLYRYPFYYVEYGLAQLGAAQVWANALSDQQQAVADYRAALALGGTVGLPALYERAGAKFGFDAALLGEAVDLIEREIGKLEDMLG